MIPTSTTRIKRILFAGHDFKFLKPIIAHYQRQPDFEVFLDEHKGHVITDTRRSENLLEQADIIFCEWCLGNAEWYSNKKKKHQLLIVRLHHQEINQNLPYLERTKWQNVDCIIFICQNNMARFLKKFPFMRDRAVPIYNLIDCHTFDIPKLYGAEFNLGMMGTVPKRKAPHLAFEILMRLKKTDKRYTLFIKGKQPWKYAWLWQRLDERAYYEEFYSTANQSEHANSVVFDPHGNDVPVWFSKIGFLLSTSEHEGSHQSVAEGMASGAIPVIRNWQGANSLYPKKFVFKTVDEAVELILKWNTRENYLGQCESVKKYAREHFDQNSLIRQYDDLMATLSKREGKIDLQKDVAIHKPNSKQIVAMHVCYLNPDNQSGYETRVREETSLLRALGFRVIIACFVRRDHAYPTKARRLRRFHRRLKESTGAKIYVIPTNHYFDLSIPPEGIRRIVRPIVALARRHNVDIMHGQALYSTMHILRARKRIKAKVIFDVHGVSPEETKMSGGHVDRVKRLEEWEREALNNADLRIYVSNRMRDFFRDKYGLSDLPHIVVPCCVHSDRFRMSEEDRRLKRKEMGIPDKFVMLYLGTLSVWQWPEAMFSLFAQFYQKRPDSLFYLLLPTSDHEKALSFLKKHNLPATSFIVDEVPHNAVGSVIGVADAGLLLRKSHPVNLVSSPTKFGEYLAAGVSVIATPDIGDTTDLIISANVGIVIAPMDKGVRPTDLDRLMTFTSEIQNNRQIFANRCTITSNRFLEWRHHSKILANAYSGLTCHDKPAIQITHPIHSLSKSNDNKKASNNTDPIFICGTGRCGTSILQLLISKHRNLFSLRYEGRFVTSTGGLTSILAKNNDRETLPVFREKIFGEWYKKKYRKGTLQEYVGGLCANIRSREDIQPLVADLEKSLHQAVGKQGRIQTVRQFVCRFYELAMTGTGKNRWIEKTPTNILYMKELLEIFPGSKLIHIYRDGRDVAGSIVANNFWPIWKNNVLKFPSELRDISVRNCAIYWRELLQYAFKTASSLSQNSHLKLKLEDLVDDPKTQLEKICDFVGEKFDEKMIALNLSQHNIGRWRKTFTKEDVTDFKKEAGDLLVEMGYEIDNEW